jgi:hypothetical protein
MKSIKVLAPAIALLAVAGAAVGGAGGAGVKKACAADIQKFCPGISDRHAERQCMKSHMAEASPDCQSAVRAAKAARAEEKAAAASSASAPAATTPH